MNYLKRFSLALAFMALANVAHAQTLNLDMAATSEVPGPDDYSTITLVVSNTGSAAAKNVAVAINLPNGIDDFSELELPGFDCPGYDCGANEIATWTVGNLAPGEGQTLFFKLHTKWNISAPSINMSAVASASNASSAPAALAMPIDPTPLLKVGVAANGPIRPGQETIYAIQLGNVGSISPSNVTLTMPVPPGTSFAWASHGGTLSSGTVSWNIGLFGSGEGRLIELAVTVDNSLAEGTIVKAQAELDPGVATEETVRSSAVGRAVASPPLHLHYGISQTAVGLDEGITFALTATNTGMASMPNVEALIMLPAFIENFSQFEIPALNCPGYDCGANEIATWSIGTLDAGQSATLNFRAFTEWNAIPAKLLTTTARLSAPNASHILIAQNVQLDPSPLLRLSLSTSPAPVVPGAPLAYTLTFGNLGPAPVPNAVLTMPVPEGTVFSSASNGGVLNNGVVSWAIPAFAAGEGDRVHLYVTPNMSLAQGEVIAAHADLVSNVTSEYPVRSTSALPVGATAPLLLKYEALPVAVGASNAVVYKITATNTGTINLLNTSALVLLPDLIDDFAETTLADFDCPGSDCDANEIATWGIGTLAPNQSKVISFSSTVQWNAGPGNILRSGVTASVSNTGTSISVAGTDVLVGTLLRIGLDENGPLPGLEVSHYPNPVLGKATFDLVLPYAAKANLKVYNGNGQEVASVMDENLPAGKSSFGWDAKGLASGLYYYRLESGTFSKTGKLVVQ